MSNVIYDGCVSVEYKDKEYDVDVTALGTYTYYPGCMYRKNGDPGDPPEENLNVDSFDVEYIFYHGNRIEIPDEELKDFNDCVQGALEDLDYGSWEQLDDEPEQEAEAEIAKEDD